ncbi:uncharacterized protein MELLADRAFT_105727 [Melampsora larici-populina 98AG31]|uniref:Wax synthase domain-containing protein n=1 Tax=Melampsora larici-populina (strain 98AG31 / pathotype 3-4-7) TaxID=747676 RepID=F4RJ64_MELLP|nr:uncharacterized protein MELLADRAFT_105727 [Melampsora larici-populina 98AG31]EGG07706.1 hypothetical protein MELLADRAFT_105727 [Melampsora larici-populina 98AG31]
MRGLNFTWGRAAMALSTAYLIKRFLPIAVPMNIAIVFITLTRDSPLKTPTSALRSIGVPNFPGLKILAESLYFLSFSIWLACLIDIRFTYHTPVSTASQKIKSLLRFPKAIRDSVNPLYLPPMFHSPQRASSVAQLWSECGHTLFKRGFVVAGGKPLVWMTKRLGGKTKLQRLAGLIGIYLASTGQHEHVMPRPSRSNPRTITSLPAFEIFFMLQPLAVLIEPYIPKRLRRTKVWNSLFLLATTYPFREQYAGGVTMNHSSVLDVALFFSFG